MGLCDDDELDWRTDLEFMVDANDRRTGRQQQGEPSLDRVECCERTVRDFVVAKRKMASSIFVGARTAVVVGVHIPIWMKTAEEAQSPTHLLTFGCVQVSRRYPPSVSPQELARGSNVRRALGEKNDHCYPAILCHVLFLLFSCIVVAQMLPQAELRAPRRLRHRIVIVGAVPKRYGIRWRGHIHVEDESIGKNPKRVVAFRRMRPVSLFPMIFPQFVDLIVILIW